MRGRREAILKLAIEIFARKGYAGASTREICQAAGITKPVLYHYFQSKEHLYQEIMIDSFGHYRKKLLAASKTRGTLRERVIRMVYADFRATKEDPVRALFLFRMAFAPEGQHPHFDFVRELEDEREVVAGVLQEGIRAGELQGNPRELATALIGMQMIATLEYLFTARPTLTRRRATGIVDLLLKGCPR